MLSASDDFNVRLWRARASEGIKPLLPREQRGHAYRERLKDRFKLEEAIVVPTPPGQALVPHVIATAAGHGRP